MMARVYLVRQECHPAALTNKGVRTSEALSAERPVLMVGERSPSHTAWALTVPTVRRTAPTPPSRSALCRSGSTRTSQRGALTEVEHFAAVGALVLFVGPAYAELSATVGAPILALVLLLVVVVLGHGRSRRVERHHSRWARKASLLIATLTHSSRFHALGRARHQTPTFSPRGILSTPRS